MAACFPASTQIAGGLRARSRALARAAAAPGSSRSMPSPWATASSPPTRSCARSAAPIASIRRAAISSPSGTPRAAPAIARDLCRGRLRRSRRGPGGGGRGHHRRPRRRPLPGFRAAAGQQQAAAAARAALRRHRRFQAGLWQLFAAPRLLAELAQPDTLICRCEELSRGRDRGGNRARLGIDRRRQARRPAAAWAAARAAIAAPSSRPSRPNAAARR